MGTLVYNITVVRRSISTNNVNIFYLTQADFYADLQFVVNIQTKTF